jgi:hypothetical protein
VSEARSSNHPSADGPAPRLRLDADDIESIAERVVDKLRGEGMGRYGDVHAVCARFGVSVDYVYAHATELGAIRLGEGPKARLRFDLAAVERALAGRGDPAKPTTQPRRARRRKQRSGPVELIPFEP